MSYAVVRRFVHDVIRFIIYYIAVRILCESGSRQFRRNHDIIPGSKHQLAMDSQATHARSRNSQPVITDQKNEAELPSVYILQRSPRLTINTHNSYDNDDVRIHGQRKAGFSGRIEQKRYFCKQRFNFNPVAGRCQPNLAVSLFFT